MTIRDLAFRFMQIRFLIALCFLVTLIAGTLFGQRPDVSSQALAAYKSGKAAELAKNPRAAVAAYQSALQMSPEMIEALNDLTYLQATDKNVLNPRAALTNAGKLLDMYYKQFINRRKVQPAGSQRLPAAFYRVTVPNTFAVVYAANGRVGQPMTMARATAAGGDCGPGAVETAVLAAQEAQTLAARSPAATAKEAVAITQRNLATIRSGKPVVGVPQPQ